MTQKRYKNLKISVILLLVLVNTGLQAQNAVPASGGDASGNGGSASYSVGQVVYTSITGISGSVAQGVQQPFEVSVVTGIEEAIGINLMISAFPNPTTDFLTLNIDNYDVSNLSYQLYDMTGKILETKKIESYKTTIVMTKLFPAIYFVKVIQDNKEVRSDKHKNIVGMQLNVVKTFKIIKNR